jgi:hypothetical protein
MIGCSVRFRLATILQPADQQRVDNRVVADFRQDPIFTEFAIRWVLTVLGISLMFPHDVPLWVKGVCAVVACVAAIRLPRNVLEMWRIAKEPPGALRNPFRRRGGLHRSHKE